MAQALATTARRWSAARAAGDRWSALATLVRARVLIALLALPVGVLLRPEADARAWSVLIGSLVALGVLSLLFWAGVRIRRGYELQIYLQLTADLALVTALAAFTGGQESQFVLFFALVVITAGVLGRLPGGAFAAAGACGAYLALPWVVTALEGGSLDNPAALPRPGMSIAFLAIVGVLAGVLGERVQRTRAALEQTTRELDRVRVDNDAILRNLTTGVLTVDARGRIAFLNPAAEQVLEVSGDDLHARDIAEALPDRLAALRELVTDSLRTGTPRVRAELMMATRSRNALPVGVSTSMLMHEDAATGVVAVFQDLTEVREMERRALRNETLAEVGALAAGIAHELRNGLNPISGSVEFLQRELRPKGEAAELMALISKESQRLNRFVTDLLSYSKEREPALVPVNLGDHLSELCESVRRDPRRPRGVEVCLEPGDAEACVRIDPEQMRQVWLNLAINAFQAIPQRGRLVVRWREFGDRRVLVEFEDDGPGIAAEDLPRVGKPFFTTKEGGTGLGLAIAQRIVERHGGTLTLDSVGDRGTTARIVLMRETRAAAVAA
jgi:two-component system sensor histidine kinase PilS (NtrC family)